MLDITNVTSLGASTSEPGLLGTYTRLYAESEIPNARQDSTGNDGVSGSPTCSATPNRRCYKEEHRLPISQFFTSYSLSRVLSLKVGVQNPNVSTTTTLASASYQSMDNKGETWNTEVNGRLLLTPYFRIDSNTTMRMEANLSATASRKDQVSGSVLAILQSAANVMAPTSPLLNPINSIDMDKTSQFISQTLAGLFSNSVMEKSVVDVSAASLTAGGGKIATVSGNFPRKRKIYEEEMRSIGEWQINAEEPIVSIFNAIPACRQACDMDTVKRQAEIALKTVSSNAILAFPVADKTSLKDKLLSDAAVISAMDALKEANGSDQAGALCNAISEKSHWLGFNRYDVAAIVTAFATTGPLNKTAADLLKKGDACEPMKLAEEIHLIGMTTPNPPE